MRTVCALFLSSLITYSGVSELASQSTQPTQENKSQQPEKAPEATSPLKQPLAFGLEDGTPIKLRLTRNLSSADEKTGDRVDFEVLEEVRVKDLLIIPRGGIAWATVTEAQAKRRMARGGKLNVNIDDVRLNDGEKAPLRAVKEAKGGGHTGAMTGAIVGTAIVFFPAAPLFLFMHGKDITIPKGTEITAYVNGDIPLDPAKFQPQANSASDSTASHPPASQGNPDQTVASISSIEVKSNPDGAEITVDDKYVGSTPSTLKLVPGDHKIKLEKTGFKTWEKVLNVTAGAAVTVNPTLDKE